MGGGFIWSSGLFCHQGLESGVVLLSSGVLVLFILLVDIGIGRFGLSREGIRHLGFLSCKRVARPMQTTKLLSVQTTEVCLSS